MPRPALWDLRMVALARRHAWLCHGIDSYCRFFAPQSLAATKARVAAGALGMRSRQAVTTCSWNARFPPFGLGSASPTRLIACGMLALVAAGVLLPLKLLTSPRPSRRNARRLTRMSRILVIGSGASGVHFAWSALQRGHHVDHVGCGNRVRPHRCCPTRRSINSSHNCPMRQRIFLARTFKVPCCREISESTTGSHRARTTCF